ncbi:PSD1 and planctomycete cytochrome C domain-containing protein [Urbifossiella limnaea]|uniref:Planctomycete cytochrome C n=1 Tax=Urbifossiella limnaea TaxID=2528023 RepID=A0A517Y173_9BACT|nr:PSD1 and planctomycete cytochrome C domain-containing protein [Urbifossiella limnaea]QDU23521.1 Planctomycete cytochrome C [Urbifossiella limnaea]
MTRTALALAAAAFLTSPLAAQPPRTPAFNADVRPILKSYCTDCHGEAEKLKGGLDLRLRRLAVAGGKSGPAVVPGKIAESLLVERVISGDMPPGKKKLSAAEIDVLRRWVAGGAAVEGPEPEKLAPGLAIAPEDRAWWAFQSVSRPPVPTAGHTIDAFVLAKLREKGLGFNRPADRVALLRRVTFDLVGLPPTPEEAEAFAADPDPRAYEKLVDRLLARPEYGERWGRHWLDVAGYADSEGGSPDDPVRTNAWKYRDYVIRAFNADKPFDRFVREQLAGDELVRPPYTNLAPADLDALIATGFLRMAPDGTGAAGADQKLARNAVLTDTVKITASAFLGLTVGCAECHNHRYDPIPQTDFYRLRAAFEPGFDLTAWKAPAARQVSLYTPDERAMAVAIEAEAGVLERARLAKQAEFIAATFEKELAKLPEDRRAAARAARDTPDAKRSPVQKKLMQEHPSLNVSAGSLYLYDAKAAAALKKMAEGAAEMRKKKPVEGFVRALTEVPGKVPQTVLFHRGDVEQPKGVVPPGGLAVLDDALPLTIPKALPPSGTSGRRLALANWLTDPRHPLTARVFVNRVWMHHFGRGLVGSPGDFGRLGERPTHPELLDWLAADFVANGWGVKRLHRLIVTSAVYRQSSVRDPKADAVDPDNRLLGRYPLRRLDAEAVRDATLATSGKLNAKAFGPPVPVMEDDAGLVIIGKANRDGAGYKLGDESVGVGDEFRRSVYVQVRRSRPLAVLAAFDPATTEPNCEARPSSTATPQALMLLNGEFAAAQAEAFAARVRRDAGADVEAQVVRAWKLAYLRAPTEGEAAAARSFLRGAAEAFAAQPAPPPQPKKGNAPLPEPPTPELRALAAFCQALLASNRFLYVE